MKQERKSKKKGSAISALNKAFGSAAGFSSLQPEAFRRELARFRATAKEMRETMGIVGGVSRNCEITAKNANRHQEARNKDNFSLYVNINWSLILGEWYDNKLVYEVPKDTFDYIEKVFPTDKMTLDINRLFVPNLQRPIYLSLPGNSVMKGVFIGLTAMKTDAFNEEGLGFMPSEETPVLLSIIVKERDYEIRANLCEHFPVSKLWESSSDSVEGTIAMKALSYICYMLTRKDAMGTVILPRDSREAETYTVLPVPGRDSFDELDSPSGWIAQGLCSWFGYLERKNMVREFLSVCEMNAGEREKPIDLSMATNQKQTIQYNIMKSVLDWERYRTVYQYDKLSEGEFCIKCLDEVVFPGFSEQLLQFMPQETMVLYQTTERDIAVVRPCKLTGHGGIGLVIVASWEDSIRATIVPANNPTLSLGNGNDFMKYPIFLRAVCCLYHILKIYEARAIKKALKDSARVDNPDDTRMAVIPPRGRPRQVPTGPDSGSDPLFRTGCSVEDIPLELFEVTPRTVKRRRDEEGKVLYGWKMTPHSRRPHPHRYWVGTGPDRHLEVRWLERIQIHKDKEVKTTVLHDVR